MSTTTTGEVVHSNTCLAQISPIQNNTHNNRKQPDPRITQKPNGKVPALVRITLVERPKVARHCHEYQIKRPDGQGNDKDDEQCPFNNFHMTFQNHISFDSW